MSDVKIGVVGLGWIAQNQHIPALLSLKGVEVAGTVEIDKERQGAVKSRFNIYNFYNSLEELVQSGIVGALVLTPKHLNGSIAQKLLQAGIHVFTEKPMASDMKTALQNVEIAKKKGVLYMVGMNRRFTDVYQMAKKEFEGRKISVAVAEKFRDSSYKSERPLMDYGIHSQDVLQWICGGEVTEVSATASFQKDRCEDSLSSILKFSNETTGVFMMNANAGTWSEKLKLIGEDITVEVDAPHSIKVMKNGECREWRSNLQGFQASYEYFGFKKQLEHFLSCIRGETELVSSGEDALKTEKLVDRIYQKAGLPGLD